MKNLNIVTGSCFEEIYLSSNDLCRTKEIHNFIIDATLPISEINSSFINLYKDDACKWHSKDRPSELIINHGEYANKFGDADEYLIKELKNKQFSNRAFVSLLNMENIINSKDNPIPSFLTIQFGFLGESSNTILVSVYYRALEVSKFLKINFAEISLYIEKIKEAFPHIEFFNLYLYAFRAQLIKDFYCLKKCEIDILGPIDISLLIFQKNKDRIKQLLLEKSMAEESLINYESLENMYNALKKAPDKAPELLIKALESVINQNKKLKKLRESTSIFQKEIKPTSDEIKNLYLNLIQEFERW